MKQSNTTAAWELYEAGKEYKQRIGLYETVRRNERFYRGDQWQDTDTDLPRPVFNLVRRITDHLVASTVPGDVSIHYSDDRLPFLKNASIRAKVTEGLSALNRNASYRWKRNGMLALSHKALLNAAISGDGIFYCWWDDRYSDGQPFRGDIHTDLVDNTDFFVADVNSTDLQSQEYVLLAGRGSVTALRREAIQNGASSKDAALIVGDGNDAPIGGDREAIDLRGAEKATYLIRFFREDGEVVFEKSTKSCVICRIHTGLRYYPVAYFNWSPTKGCFHGSAPISDMIANQRYVNVAYAMAMKHLYHTAFSKVVYDQTRIPEWSNEIGEAIAAVGGGNVADTVSVIGVGQMQEGYLDLIESVMEHTKRMMGATDSALGDADATNTSAILALQEASRISLRQVSSEFCRCIGELAAIWADMLCTYCPPERLLLSLDGDEVGVEHPDYRLLREELLRATAEISQVSSYTPSSTVAVLDKLLTGGQLRTEQYLELLPAGSVTDRDSLIAAILENQAENQENQEKGT